MRTPHRLGLLATMVAAALACSAGDSDQVVLPVDDASTSVDAGQRDAAAATFDGAVRPPDGAAGGDVGAPGDAPGDAPAGDAAARTDRGPGCGEREFCGNMLDDDCDGAVDEGCACAPMDTQRCYTGDSGQPGRGACAWGTQRCVGVGEFGTWSDCAGQVLPGDEVCDGLDNDCDGMVDEVPSRSCYGGRSGTMGVGPCRGGTQACTGGAWGACAGEVAPGVEACDGLDNDCNGVVDDHCNMCLTSRAGTSPWQMSRAMGPVCFGRTFSAHGEAAEFALASVPPEADASWTALTAATIDFSQVSTLCGRECECLNGGEFTYFQTYFDIPAGFTVRSLTVTMQRVDDGARVTVYNSAHPSGVVEPGSYVALGGGGSTADLAGNLVVGRNRVVITHLDDCCSERYLTGVRLVLNGAPLGACM